MIDSLHFARRLKPPCPASNISRKVRKRPVLAATCDLLRLRMDRDHPAARERSNVRPALLVQSKIPPCDALSPVARDLRETVRPPRPVGQVIGLSVVWTALGPID